MEQSALQMMLQAGLVVKGVLIMGLLMLTKILSLFRSGKCHV